MKYLSNAKAKELIFAAVERFPDRLNPTCDDTGACLYTDPDDPTVHCIAGQVLADLGIPLPREGHGFPATEEGYDFWEQAERQTDSVALVNKGYMSKATAILLGKVQTTFDSGTLHGESWSESLAHAQQEKIL